MSQVQDAAVVVPNDSPIPAPNRAIFVARVVLVAAGSLLTIWGFWLAFTTNRPQSLLGLATWLLGALVLHDGILSTATWALNRLLRGVSSKLPLSVVAVIQGAVITLFLMSLLALPLIAAKAKGPQISTLPLNYGLNYALVWVVVTLFTAPIAVGLLIRSRRR